MSDDKKEKLIADLRALDFSRSKPTAIGDVHGERDRWGNILQDPKRLPSSFPPVDYSKMPSGMLYESFQDVEKRQISEFIQANPQLDTMGLYKAFMEARGYKVPHQIGKLPASYQQEPEKD